MKKTQTFQEFIYSLCHYWTQKNCVWSQPYDQPMGAGTFHPHTFFKSLGKNAWNSVYVQPCRRPVDGRYGKSPNRLQHYYQLQVLLKPAPQNVLDIYINSLEHVGISLRENDIALYEDNWKSPTLGAWGLGWEVRANGEEVTQFTYFQEFGGLPVELVPAEITYGLERLYMYRYGYQNVMDIPFNNQFTYGDIYYQNENEFSQYNFHEADTSLLFSQFDLYEKKVKELCAKNLSLPAYDYVLQASHAFNTLDARGALSVTERQRFLGRVRDCAKTCALSYNEHLEKLNLPSHNFKKIAPAKSSLESYENKSSTQKLSAAQKKKTVDIIFEIGAEELPPQFQKTALKSLQNKLKEGISKFSNQYSYDDSFVQQLSKLENKVYVSTRRLAIECKNVPQFTPEQEIELWGPAERIAKDAEGGLTQAGIGFCQKQNINPKHAKFKLNPKSNVSFLYAQKRIPASDFPTILIEAIKTYFYQLDAAVKMRWLPLDIQQHEFIRPVRWLLCLVDNKVFPIEMFGLKSSSYTSGQRVLSSKRIAIQEPSEYKNKLSKAHVTIDYHDRERSILKQMEAIFKILGSNFILVPDDNLLEKCIGLSESPYMFLGEFDKQYLKLPAKLISSVLKEHMNYFSVWNQKEKCLAPYYIGIANYKCTQTKSMVLGTKKVVTSRLEDGAFYFENDLNTPIKSLREQLKNQIFQDDLGTLYDKSERLSFFAKHLAELSNLKNLNVFSEEDYEIFTEAGRHCKNDLKTGCVQEFPDDMQGVMGGVLVRAQNAFQYQFKSDAIAQAIEGHYLPENANSALPASKYAKVLALADKLDSLILLLSAGYEPKGSQDPFGLRRLAIAIARLLNIKHEEESTLCRASFQELIHTWQTACRSNYAINTPGLNKFFTERLKSILKEDFPTTHVESIAKHFVKKPVSDFAPLLKSLQSFLLIPDCLIPYKRARSMTQHLGPGQVLRQNLILDSEQKLYTIMSEVEHNLRKYFNNSQFDLFFEELSKINEPLSAFFDTVMVNDPNLDIRQNRLQILYKIKTMFEEFVDFSVIQGF